MSQNKHFTFFATIAILSSFFFLTVSCENVELTDIYYSIDEEGKFFTIGVKNYGNQTNGSLDVKFIGDKFNDSLIRNFEILPKQTMEFKYYYNFCECNISARLKVNNNVNKLTAISKNFTAVDVNFDELNLNVSGRIFPAQNATFEILDTENLGDFQSLKIKRFLNTEGKAIYKGNIVNKKFSFELDEIGIFIMIIKTESCNISKDFRTKYNTTIKLKTTDGKETAYAKEGKETIALITDQKGSPISGVPLSCDAIACGRTDGNGIFKFFANKTFVMSVPETASTWPTEKEIKVQEQQKIEIITKKDENEQENFSIDDFATIILKSNNLPLENVSVKIIKHNEIDEMIINTTINKAENIALKKEGTYEIFAEKENFKSASKVFFVRRNFDVNISADDENEKVKMKVLDDITKKGVSGAVVTIEYAANETPRTEKTDIDGDIIFKIPEERYKFCVDKENYNKFCKDIESMKKIEIRLSKNYIFENHYSVFSDLSLTTFYTYKDIQLVPSEIFVTTKKGNFSIYPKSAQSHIFLDEIGKYEIKVTKEKYKESIVTIFAEKTDIDVYMSISKNYLIINLSKPAKEILIECNDMNKIILQNIANEKICLANISERNCEVVLSEEYRGKFYVDNIPVATNSTDKFKFRIKLVRDPTWMYMAIIVITLLSLLVIVQHRYKKPK